MTSLSGYTVVIKNLSRGWQMSVSSDLIEVPEKIEDPNDLSLRRILTAPFKARWGFKDGLIPNPMDPERVTFNMWARTLADEYVVDLGDVVTVEVYAVDPWFVLIYVNTGRVTEADSDLVPTDPWAVRTKVEVTGFTADLGPKAIQPAEASPSWRAWWLRAEYYSGSPFFLPTGLFPSTDAMAPTEPNTSIRALVDRLIHSYSPADQGFTYVASYNAATPNTPPAGYARPAWNPGDGPQLGLPATGVRYVVVPAGRNEFVAFAKPLQFVVRAGQVTVSSTPGSTSPKRHPAVAAAWCRIPTNVRRTRDHIVNDARLKGQAKSTSTMDYRATSLDVINLPDQAARGTLTREVETQMVIREYDLSTGVETGPHVAAVTLGQTYLSDSTVLASTRAYESLEVYPHLIPDGERANVLPYLTPSVPGSAGDRDGRLLRHVTVYGLDDALTSDTVSPGGFITAGELTIERGVMRLNLTTTPGQPRHLANTPAAITVGGFIVKSFATSTSYNNTKVDPVIRVGDLDKIGA